MVPFKMGVYTAAVICWPKHYYGGAYVISNQNPRWTQKPIYTPICTHHIRSSLLCTPVITFLTVGAPQALPMRN